MENRWPNTRRVVRRPQRWPNRKNEHDGVQTKGKAVDCMFTGKCLDRFKPTPTNPAHPIYEKAGIAAVQFRPGLVMTNYSRVLMKRGSGPFEVMAGNITVPDPNTGVVGVPRTKFATRAESFFYGRRNSGAGMRIETRISDYEYPDFNTHFYWPMRLPEMYLDTTAPPTPLLEDDGRRNDTNTRRLSTESN